MRYHIDKSNARPTWIDKSIVICSTVTEGAHYMQVGRDKTTKGVLFSVCLEWRVGGVSSLKIWKGIQIYLSGNFEGVQACPERGWSTC